MKKVIANFTTRFLLLSVLALPLASVAQDGSLDLTFSTDGIVNTDVGTALDNARSIAIQTDGKIVVAGFADVGGDFDFAVVRYNTDGSLDNTFDSDGKVTTPVGVSMDYAYSVAIQSDGKIVVVGQSNIGGNNDFAVVRYNTNGSLDNTFDTDGKVTTPIGAYSDVATFVTIQSDGKIVVVGSSNNVSGFTEFALVRYNTDGSLDNTLDTDGMLTTVVGNDDFANSAAIQSDGKIVVVGYSDAGASYDFALVRYNTDGSLDNSLDIDGMLTTSIGNFDEARSVAVQSDGKIVVAGRSNNGSNYDFSLVRYNSNGSLDNSFDSDGILTTSIGVGDNEAYALAIQSDGKIIVAGISNNGSSIDFTLVRYNTNGSLDNTFDTDGIVTTDIATNTNEAFSLALQSDGKIVVVGNSYNGSDFDFAVVRYNNPSLSVGITEISSLEERISVYPNPFSVSITFISEFVLNNATITVYNTLGEEVRKIKNVSGHSVILQRDNLLGGVYFMTITQGDATFATKKIIVAD